MYISCHYVLDKEVHRSVDMSQNYKNMDKFQNGLPENVYHFEKRVVKITVKTLMLIDL